MRDHMELDSGRPEGAGETKEQAELRALDDVTFEPGESVEQKGDYRQAEEIQAALSEVVEAGPPAKDDAGVQLDGKGGRPASVVSLNGKGNDLSAGDVPLAAPQASVHTNGGPAFTLDGKGTDRPPLPAGEVPPFVPEKPQRGAAPGQGETSARERGVEDGAANIQFRVQEATNIYNKSEHTRSDVKKKSDGTDEDIIKNLKG
jgi:hypothetical protein